MVRQLNRVLAFTAFLLILAALLGRVSVAQTNNGRTAADFLNIGQGARAAGLGGAFTAVAEGPSAAYWNPAGFSGVARSEILLSHFSWYQDLSVEHGAGAIRVNDRLGLGVAVTYMNYGRIDEYDANGNIIGELSVYDWSAGVSAGYVVSDQVRAGITAKFINQRLDNYSASAMAADLGVQVSFDRFAVALMLANLGTGMKFDAVTEDLPAFGRLGVAVRPWSEYGIMVAADIEKQFHGDMVLRQGVEYGYDNRYFLRAGMEYQPSRTDWAVTDGLTFGAGVRLSNVQFDYAFTPGGMLVNDDLHRFSLTFGLGN